MRVGSIGTGFVRPMSNNNKKTQNNNPAFKCDVRVAPTSLDEKSGVHAKKMEDYLLNVAKRFKNVGSDNLMIILEPRTNGWKKESMCKSAIDITALYKDPEKARIEILDHNREKLFKGDEKLAALRDRNPESMAKLRSLFKMPGNEYGKDGLDDVFEETDDEINRIISLSKSSLYNPFYPAILIASKNECETPRKILGISDK